MFTQYDTEDYLQEAMDSLNAELDGRLKGIEDPDEKDIIEESFSDEAARRMD